VTLFHEAGEGDAFGAALPPWLVELPATLSIAGGAMTLTGVVLVNANGRGRGG
jgi:hypothetical protein